MTADRVFPEPNSRHFSKSVDKRADTFIARMRFHQSWYRANVLRCEPGPNPNARGTRYGNMLTAEDGTAGRNFLTEDIFASAMERYPIESGSRSSARVYNNLLSSEPMCFNLFGPLKANTALATRLMKLLPGFPEDGTVTRVRFEKAPSRKEDYLNDSTAFDCLVEYERPSDVRGFIGIETKLTEPFSQDSYPFSERYSMWMSRPNWWWIAGAEDRFPDMLFNQLWRNHLLVFSTLRQPTPHYQEGFCAVVYPKGDVDCGNAIDIYSELLTEAGAATMLDWKLDSLVSSWEQELKGEEEHDWILRFKERYLDLDASEGAWQAFCEKQLRSKTDIGKRALELLRVGSGIPDAQFREGQEEAIRHVVNGDGRLLVVQKTGWGKSFVYFIATKILREAGRGPALLVSPLLALMRNQIAAAERMGVKAATINSGNKSNWEEVIEQVNEDEVDILIVSPERLAMEGFRTKVLEEIAPRISLLVIDEAHCISDWGHDFRPNYRLIERIARELPSNMRLLATTATANQRVMDDLQEVLGPDLTVMRGDLNRPSLTLQTLRIGTQSERLAWIAQALPQIEGSGIVYALTIRDANLIADWLRSRGMEVKAYTGQTGDGRPELEDDLMENRVKALVATTALGMGFDKPDLAFVIHYQAPGSVVGYYQQVGRAGRALDGAYGILLSGHEELEINEFFIKRAFPTEMEVRQVLDALEQSDEGLALWQMRGVVNLKNTRIEKTVSLLSLESPAPVVRNGGKWQLTAAPLGKGLWDRAERLTRIRELELEQMQEYVGLTSGHMDFLIRALDGEPSADSEPVLETLEIELDSGIVQDAVDFLKRTGRPIEPRGRWPMGGMPEMSLTNIIPEEERNLEGRALCTWGDAGWAGLVEQGKYKDDHFDGKLVDVCVQLVEKWGVDPKWVTWIPSLRRSELVKDFAQRLARKLDLPAIKALTNTGSRPEQKTMQNGTQQARNMDGAFAVETEAALPVGPVLLVDDMVDSRWTMTVAGWLIQSHGGGPVLPLALAMVGGV